MHEQFVEEGSSEIVTVEAGKTLVVETSGETYVDRLAGLIDTRYSSERLVKRSRTFKARDMSFTVRIRAIKEITEYTVGYPNAHSRDIAFGRDDNGNINAIIDPITGLPVNLSGDGPQGPQGPLGPAGPQGMQGEQGPAGPQGDLGPEGPIGPQGVQGERGPDGRSITIQGRLASEAELPATGNAEGDAYIVTTDGAELVFYWFDGAWVGTGIAQGPEGPPGSQGPQGPQGEVGPAGPQGQRGLQGVQGPAGEGGGGDGNPIGAVLQWFSPILPIGYIWADQYVVGQYPALDAMYPNGIPDFANRVFRHVGNLTGEVGTTQNDAMQRIQASVGHLWGGGPTSSSGAFTVAQGNTNARPDTTGRNWNTRINFDSNRVTRTATETRVKSVIFRAIIKAY